jgi:hypothetical protein
MDTTIVFEPLPLIIGLNQQLQQLTAVVNSAVKPQ